MRTAPLLWMLIALSAPVTLDGFWNRYAVAAAIWQQTEDVDEARALMGIAAHESGFRSDVIDCRVRGDHGSSLGAFQVQPRSSKEKAQACGTLDEQTRLALARVRESMRACAMLPKAERLSVYCDGRISEKGKRQSRERMGAP